MNSVCVRRLLTHLQCFYTSRYFVHSVSTLQVYNGSILAVSMYSLASTVGIQPTLLLVDCRHYRRCDWFV